MTAGSVSLIPVTGIGEVTAGDDVAGVVHTALTEAGLTLHAHDIVVVTHKIVSKAEGRVAPASDDAAYRELVEQEAASIVRRRGDLVIAITEHGCSPEHRIGRHIRSGSGSNVRRGCPWQ